MTETVETRSDLSMLPKTETASKMFGALFAASRKTVEGVIEVDKALIGYARDAVTGYVELGKESLQAKSLNDLLDLHVARAHSRIETTAANTREIVELTRQKVGEAYVPVKEVFQTSQSTDAA
ncbi:MAG: phasin family protein [Pseudomonadota bacterium]